MRHYDGVHERRGYSRAARLGPPDFHGDDKGDMAPNLIMLGPPWAGKGTQAERFARAPGFREFHGRHPSRGRACGHRYRLRVKAVMDRGELVGDDVMIGIVRSGWIGRTPGGVRSGGLSAHRLRRRRARRHRAAAPLIIVDIVVPESELVRRLSFGRFVRLRAPATRTGGAVTCNECGGRLFSAPTTPTPSCCERWGVSTDTKPLVEYYRARPRRLPIDGAQAPDRVTADIAVRCGSRRQPRRRAAEGQTR